MDIDGTVLADDLSMPETNRIALRKLREAGSISAYASGRRDIDMKAMGDDALLVDYHIINTGGKIVRIADNKVVRLDKMDPEECLKMIEFALENNLQIQISNEGKWMTNKMTKSTSEYMHYLHATPIMFSSPDEVHWQDGIDHIMASEDMWEVKAFVDENLVKVKGVQSQDDVVDFMPAYLTKLIAIKNLADMLGIPEDHIVTVGNHYNDIEMIEGAGIGIAVASSIQGLKDVADYVTESDNNAGAMAEIVDGLLNNRYQPKKRKA